MSEAQVPEQSPSVADRPGRRLAQARKARGLTVEEVAAHLRLNLSTLRALEADDYARLPPAAYVSGYLRAYARMLGLNEAEATSAAVAASEPTIGSVSHSHGGQVRATDAPVRIVTYIVVGGLLVLSSVWWLMQNEEVPPAPMPELVVTEQAAEVPPAEDSAASPAAVVEPPMAEIAVGALPSAVAPVATPPPLAAAPALEPAVAPAPEPKIEEPAKPTAPPPPPLTPDIPQSKIALEFSADCWVEVVDASGRQLAYAVYPTGRALTLRGEAPFKVFFGYSPGVQVFFNGELFDHMPFQRRDTARFKLGTAEDNQPLTEAQ